MWVVAAVALVASTTAAAQGAAPAQALPEATTRPGSSPARPEAPQLHHHGGVAYVSGTIDAAGRAHALQLAPDMNLELVFARVPSGRPLSDVAVEITDSHGQVVLELASARSLLLARLVPGSYSIAVTAHGQMQRSEVVVPGQGRHTAAFNWSDSASMEMLESVATRPDEPRAATQARRVP